MVLMAPRNIFFLTCQSILVVVVVVVVSLSAFVVGILIERRLRVSACNTYKLRSAKSVAYILGQALISPLLPVAITL